MNQLAEASTRFDTAVQIGQIHPCKPSKTYEHHDDTNQSNLPVPSEHKHSENQLHRAYRYSNRYGIWLENVHTCERHKVTRQGCECGYVHSLRKRGDNENDSQYRETNVSLIHGFNLEKNKSCNFWFLVGSPTITTRFSLSSRNE